jgi:hypothetical protein
MERRRDVAGAPDAPNLPRRADAARPGDRIVSRCRDAGDWTLHLLDARGDVGPFAAPVEAAVADVRARAGRVARLPAIDIVVGVAPGRVIPEIGHLGWTPRAGLIHLLLDPGNENLGRHLGEPLARMIAHELHHALRWESVGYGTTLGEALVSEGLAGRFAGELYASPPEPWERALGPADIAAAAADALREARAARYDHAAWFFGGGARARWTGYALGYALAGRWLETTGRTAAGSADAPAEDVLAALGPLAAA